MSAVMAHGLAKEKGGILRLRIDDIDGTRSRQEFVDAAIFDLEWLGLGWDGMIVFQSQRLDQYEAALAQLSAMGLIYPCFCTRSEIAAEVTASISAPHEEFGPAYPGTCRHLSDDERMARVHEPHCWRLDMDKALAGTMNAEPQAAGDVVLARKDAPASYHLASTLDDAAMGITDVVRGKDLFASTHIHRLLQALLGLPTPLYHHHPLIAGADGKRLAKRDAAMELAMLRERGVDGAVLTDHLWNGRLPAGYSFL